MDRYQPSIPRAGFGAVAIAMTAITISLAVIVPTKLASGSQKAVTLTASKAQPMASTEVAIVPARIDVVAAREPKTAYKPVPLVPPGRKQQG